MLFLGLFLIAFGAFALFQARLPRAKRKIYPRSRRWPWSEKDQKPLGTYGCIGLGISFSVAGILFVLTVLHVVQIDDTYFPLIPISLFVIMIAGIIVDGLKKEPNQSPEPMPLKRPGSS